VRSYWISWFKKFVDLSVALGAESMGSHFGIFTKQESDDAKKRAHRLKDNIEAWHQIAEYAKKQGLRFLTWEPMSIHREQGETISETRKLQTEVNRKSPLPFLLCLDVDHGDLSSNDPKDTDPYFWLKEFSQDTPYVHLKQSSSNKGGHWPFTEAYNKDGRIQPEKVLEALDQGGESSSGARYLFFEMSFREREPADSSVVAALKESVKYWRPWVKD